MLGGIWEENTVTITDHAVEVVASAVSSKRSVMAEVSADGFVCAVRLLTDAAKRWDSWDLGDRLVAVAAVAHDRYLSKLPNRDGRFPTAAEVADAERKLNF